MPDQVGDPLRILHVRLAPGHVAHVRGVADNNREGVFQGCMDRLPVDPGRLHADVGHAHLAQPIAKGCEITSHGAESSGFP